MFKRFTDTSRHVVVLAQREAVRLRHNYIGTEHELLGLLAVDDPVVQAAVGDRITVDKARAAVEEIVRRGEDVPSGHIPFTPRAKKVLELSLREALRLRHRSIQPGHVLLGLLREGEGVGAQVLAQAGVDFEQASARIVAELDRRPEETPPEPGSSPTEPVWLSPPLATTPEQILAQARQACSEEAAAAIDRASAGGVDATPTPWSLLVAIAEGDGPSAALLAGLDLSWRPPTPPPGPPKEPVGRPFDFLFQRAHWLASALGPLEPVPGAAASSRDVMARVTPLHLLAVLLSPGEGSVADELAELGADAAALRRQVLALL